MRELSKMLQPVRRKISTMIGRAILRAVDDGSGTQKLQIELLKDELYDGVERFQEYGFTSNPHAGAEAVSLSVGGQRGHGVVIAVNDRRYRVTALETGEVAIYTDEDTDGHRIHFKRNREIHHTTGTTTIVQKPTSITLTVGSEIVVLDATGLHHNGKNIGRTHTHPAGTPNTGTPNP